MKKVLSLLLFLFFYFPAIVLAAEDSTSVNAELTETSPEAEQVFEMKENKVVVNVLKQPLNENSKQKIILKKNWFVVNIGINGKVKVNPISATYEVQ